ncbi:putative double-strand-break repair protein RAD21 [Vairimorpha necatrix]|uniref:Double-strand-break repair protein RAD21 n=1 Tax=Vairimorpha necatrix TaxID=6039 RepID=A0AAX4J9R6_9MICR
MYTIPLILKICKKTSENTIKKQDLKQTDINKMLIETSLNNSTTILICVVKIYCKKIKYLLDESNEILTLLGYYKKIKVNREKRVVEQEDVYISDIIVPDITSDYSIEPMRDDEEIRDSTHLQSLDSTLLKSFNIPIKRKKLEDEIIEYDSKYYRDNICGARISAPPDHKINTKYNFNIPEFFNERLKLTVESMRDETLLEQYNEISIGEQYGEDIIESFNNESISEYDVEKCLDIDNLPNKFVFNEHVEYLDKEDKAKLFFDLLRQASIGKISVEQDNPDSSIICTINI